MIAWLYRWLWTDLWIPVWPNLVASALWALPGGALLLRRVAAHHRAVHARLDEQDERLASIRDDIRGGPS